MHAPRSLAGAVTQAFNGGLSQILAQLQGALPGINFIRLDAYRLLNDIVGDPSVFGLSSVTSACLMPNGTPFICQHPDQYLFWDGIHPTKAGHAILAQEAAAVAQQVRDFVIMRLPTEAA